jgi:YegS/Rv2252/BmrU family lipid kinase
VDDRHHRLLFNPSSAGGKNKRALPEVEAELQKRGLSFHTVTTRSLEHGIEESLAAADAGELPVVMSGDGLIGQIGGALAGRNATMGLIPGGRGNDLARVLGISKEIPEAVGVLAAGQERLIDVGEANGRRFLGIASMGFDSVANRLANRARVIRGTLVYVYAALRGLAGWKPATFSVTVDGERHRVTGYAVAAANNKAFGGGMFIAPDAKLDDGQLDVVMTAQVGKLRFLANLPKVFKGTHVENDEITILRGSRVEVTADRPFEVYADGEHLTDLPATIGVLPGALRLIAPPADAPPADAQTP